MMSGPKLEGLAATDLTHRGNFSTKDSHINFVVPGDKPSQDLRQECSQPGILFLLKIKIAFNYDYDKKVYKLTVDLIVLGW